MDISVVVPTYNRRAMVLRSLETLFVQDYPSSRYEIIVVVDGSKDGTAESLKALKPTRSLRVIEQENRGLAGARNTGFRAAEADLVLFLDDDMLCDPGLISAHVSAHEAKARMAGFGALFLSEDSPPSLAAECFNREIGAFHLKRILTPETPWQETDCVFSNSSLRRSLLVELGGFDETFRMREDLELGVRLFTSGVRPQYIENAIAYQYYDKSAADLIRDAEAFAVSDARFARKHPEAIARGHLGTPSNEPRWKCTLRRIFAISPAVADVLLAPVCGLGQTFFHVPVLRTMGVRALQMRRRIHWLHKVQELDRSSFTVRTANFA